MLSIVKKLSISKKLTLIYSSILMAILLVFTLFTFVLIRSFMIKDSQSILSSNADIITNYIETNGTINKLDSLNLSQDINYIIYDDNKNIIFSNTGKEVPNFDRHQNKRFRGKDAFERKEGAMSTSRTLKVNSKAYYIYVTRNFEDIGDRAGDIAEILITIGVLGMIVSLISGFFLSRKLLKPIKDITKTAKEITSKSLDKRIVLNGAKDELNDLADTFNLMIERLQIDFEKQKRFVSDASHELRTPLAVISGHVNLLNRWGKNDAEQLDKSLKTLKNETHNMNRLIENLLYLAKGDNAVLLINKEEIKLSSLLREVVDETKLSYENVEISYESSRNILMKVDYSKLKQVIRILIDNSIKFSKDTAKITIAAFEKYDKIHISLIDNGIGIPNESLSKIFDRFYRVDESRTKATGGTGLGLSIAKQIVEGHGGEILAESRLGEGTEIHIILPMFSV
jgi:signal transduction histidine kinase